MLPSRRLDPKRFLFRGPVWSVVVNYSTLIESLERLVATPYEAVGAHEVDFVNWAHQVIQTYDVVVVDHAVVPLEFAHLIAEQFVHGTFEIVHNETNERIRAVVVEDYEYYCGPLCAGAGRVYYLPDCTVFYIEDLWFS